MTDDTEHDGLAQSRIARLGVPVAAGAFVATVVVAVARVLVGDWYPVGDNAYFALRGRDVLTEHHPLLGTWTSASRSAGIDFNNPGPLLFDLYAPVAKIDPELLPVAVAALVLGSVLACAWCASRIAGRNGVLVALFASSALAFAMGPELLVDPWQPHALLFPFLALLGASWAACAGSDGSLLVVAGAASLLVQTHLSYAPMVALLAGAAVVAALVRAVRDPERRRHAARMGLATVALLSVLWIQPMAEQLTGDGQGNLSRLLEVPGAERENQVGLSLGTRVAGTVVGPVAAWVPPSFEDEFEQVSHRSATTPRFVSGPSTTKAAASLAAALVVLGAVGFVARRRGADGLAVGAAVVALAIVAGWVTVVLLPLNELGIPAHHVRWLWPVSIGVTTVIVACALARRAGVAAIVGAAVTFCILAAVPTHPAEGPTSDEYAAPVMRALGPQLDGLAGEGPLLLDPTGSRIFEPYTAPVMLELDRRGVEVVVDDPIFIRQLGSSRAADGDQRGRFFVWQGDLAVDGRPGLERVAFVDALDPAEAAELAALTADVERWLRDGEILLTEIGRLAAADGLIADIDEAVATASDPFGVVGGYDLEVALSSGFADAAAHRDAVDRWVELRTRFVRGTVAVWVEWAAP